MKRLIPLLLLIPLLIGCKPVAIYDNKGKLTSVGAEWIETDEPGTGENILNTANRTVDQGTNFALNLLGNPVVYTLLGGGGLTGLVALQNARSRKREDALFDEGVRRGATGEVKPN